MSTASTQKTIVLIVKKGETGLLGATSPNMRSLFAVGRNEKELIDDIKNAIQEFMNFSGIQCTSIEVDTRNNDENWECRYN